MFRNIILTLLLSFSALADCDLPKNWMKTEELDRAEVWAPAEPRNLSERQYEAALVLNDSKGKCLAVTKGYRKPGEVKMPFFNADLFTAILSKEISLIGVQSHYSHGYSETHTALYFFDSKGKRLKEVWSEKTSEVSGQGSQAEGVLSYEDKNEDGIKDLIFTFKGIAQIWLWNKSAETFDLKD